MFSHTCSFGFGSAAVKMGAMLYTSAAFSSAAVANARLFLRLSLTKKRAVQPLAWIAWSVWGIAYAG